WSWARSTWWMTTADGRGTDRSGEDRGPAEGERARSQGAPAAGGDAGWAVPAEERGLRGRRVPDHGGLAGPGPGLRHPGRVPGQRGGEPAGEPGLTAGTDHCCH